MIAGTPFVLADFEQAWRPLRARCRRFVPDESAEHAWQECDEGNAVCLACADGLAVLALEVVNAARIRANVLLAASTGEPGAFERHQDSMVAIARDMGAQELYFWTNRPRAWARTLGPEWRRDGEKFSRSIE